MNYETYVNKIYKRAFVPSIKELMEDIINIDWDLFFESVKKELLADDEFLTAFRHKNSNYNLMLIYTSVIKRVAREKLSGKYPENIEIKVIKIMDCFIDSFIRGYFLGSPK